MKELSILKPFGSIPDDFVIIIFLLEEIKNTLKFANYNALIITNKTS